MSQHADYLITNTHMFTMAGTGVGYIRDGAIAIKGNRIIEVGTTADLTERISADETIDATGHALLPGLIDIHMHTPLAIVRGVAQDVANWMQKGLAPYARHLTPEGMHAGTRLNIFEGVRSGTTTFGDYAWPRPGWAEIYDAAGVRAMLTPTINAMPVGGMAGWKVGDIYPLDDARGKETMDAGYHFAKEWNGQADGRIRTMMGPQGPDMLSTEQLLEVKRLASKEGLMVHLHTAQGDREIDQMVGRYDMRTPAYLEEIGMLDEQLLAVHLTEATDEETRLIAKKGARMALCSGSIGTIDGIVPPAHVFREAGGIVGLGSDQAPGNNCNNVWNEMKLTAMFNKIKYRDPTIMPAWEVLRMGTIEGAQAIGMGDEIGSLEVGKQADLILVDIANEPNLLPALQEPIRTIVPNLIYAGTGREVVSTMVAGKFVMRDREMLTLNSAEITQNAQHEAEKIAALVLADPVHKGMALLEMMEKGQL